MKLKANLVAHGFVIDSRSACKLPDGSSNFGVLGQPTYRGKLLSYPP